MSERMLLLMLALLAHPGRPG